jgi:hypothetical protein
MTGGRHYMAIDTAGLNSDHAAAIEWAQGEIRRVYTIPREMMANTEATTAFVANLRLAAWMQHLRRYHIGEEILARVWRLNMNTNWQEGTELRGMRRKAHEFDAYLRNAMPKGEFIREYGRANFEAIPHHLLYKRGRRRWVSYNAVRERVWEIWQGRRRVDYVQVCDGNGFYGDNLRLSHIPWAVFAAHRGFAA